MSRIRSPGYPNASLQDAIEFVRKIHAEDRQYGVPRETAAQHMGFTGASGSSDRAISALFHFGLAEKVIKGEIRVTDLAVRLIHPDTQIEKRDALHEAGFKPDLFQELRAKYPGQPPSYSTLTSYLTRQGFATVAIAPAAKAYIATCDYLQRENAYESGSADVEDEAPSPPMNRREEASNMHTQVIPYSAPPPPPMPTLYPVAAGDLALNVPKLDVRGGTVRLEALLDVVGLDLLERQIAALRTLMAPFSTVVVPPSPAPNLEGSKHDLGDDWDDLTRA